MPAAGSADVALLVKGVECAVFNTVFAGVDNIPLLRPGGHHLFLAAHTSEE